MTFYWWSHWFWITLLCNVLCSFTIVQTYPTQEILPETIVQNTTPSATATATATTTAKTSSTILIATVATTAPANAATSSHPKSHEASNIERMSVMALNDAASAIENDDSGEILLETGDDMPITLNEKPERIRQGIRVAGGGINDDDEDLDDVDMDSEDDRSFENAHKRSAETFNSNHTENPNSNNNNNNNNHNNDDQNHDNINNNHNNNDNSQSQQPQQNSNSKENSEILQLTKDFNDRDDQITDLSAKKATTTTTQTPKPSAEGSFEVQEPVTALAVKSKREESEIKNNFTNFSSKASELSTNSTASWQQAGNASRPGGTPATPQIFNSEASVAQAEWLDAAAAVSQLPPESLSNIKSDKGNLEAEIDDNDDNITAASHKIPFTLENVNKQDDLHRAESEHRTRKSKVLSADYKQVNRLRNYSTDSKSLLARSASTAPNNFDGDNDSNISSEALSIQRTYFLDAGAISAICFTVFGVCCTVGTVGIVLYRRRYLNKPHTLSEPDSSVYIDDSTMRVSDNSDEMYSLDNDSFLNSLEAMTIQNYWTDTVKHTKL